MLIIDRHAQILSADGKRYPPRDHPFTRSIPMIRKVLGRRGAAVIPRPLWHGQAGPSLPCDSSRTRDARQGELSHGHRATQPASADTAALIAGNGPFLEGSLSDDI